MFLVLFLLGWARATSEATFAHSAQWLNLLHYQKTLNGFESEADGPGFFFAPDGRTNPEAELVATIKALRETAAACKFPARKLVLERALGLTFPEVMCPDYEEWRRGLPVTDVALVFATAYPHNPASMFGHTFLRLKGPGDGRALLDYAVNFAATTGSDGGVEFALLGVFGGYQGHYSLAPYFIKVNEYNHGEARDLWEYPLRLSAAEIDVLLAHLWEVESSTWFDYWFFDENCSWQLLRLLEVAKPELVVSSTAPFYIIPADTVRILDAAGELGAPVQRPSLRRQYLARPEPRNHTEALDKKLALYQILARTNKLTARQSKQYQEALLARSKEPAPQTPVSVPAGTNAPHAGHGLRRLALTAGDGFQRLQLRLSQHDLLDPDLGHEPWSTLDVLRLTLEARERAFVREFTLAEVISISPVNALGFSPSWFTRFGARASEALARETLTGAAEAGLGGAIGGERGFVSLMGMGEVLGDRGASLGVRVLSGVGSERWKLTLDVRRLWRSEGAWWSEVAGSLSLGRDWALRSGVTVTGERETRGALSLLRYF